MEKFWGGFGGTYAHLVFVCFSAYFDVSFSLCQSQFAVISVSVCAYISFSLRLYQFQFAVISVSVCAGSIITVYYKIMLNHHSTLVYYKNSDYLCIGVG